MTSATLLTAGARPAVRLERYLPDPLPIVWRAITEPEKLDSWFPCGVLVAGGDWVLGAAITFPFPPEVIDLTVTGQVLALDKPRLLAYSWGEEVLRFELSSHERGTQLVLIDELAPSAAARNAAGWETCLDRLAGLEPAPEAWSSHFSAYSSTFEPVLGLQEGPPAGYKGG